MKLNLSLIFLLCFFCFVFSFFCFNGYAMSVRRPAPSEKELLPEEEKKINPQALAMVETQLKPKGIYSEDVINAMLQTPRVEFVPESQKRLAYADRPLPIGWGQTISQPLIVAYMTQIINPDSSQKVLEIGAGSGYQAAVLANIVKDVYTIEIIRPLGLRAAALLERLGYDNVSVKIGDGYYGWEEHAPFDAIVVTAAAEYIPPPLLRQLKDGGRMIIPVGSPFNIQYLTLIEKNGDEIRTKRLMPVRFVPFTRVSEEDE